MVLLLLQVLGDFEINLLLAEVESKFNLHLVKSFLDLNEGRLEVRTGLNQVLSELLASLAESALAHVALPGSEDFLDQVKFEELHACQHVE